MQQQGGSQYGVPPPPPEMAPPFPSPMIGIGAEYLQPAVAEDASPINSRPAPASHQASIFEDYGSGARAAADEEDGERGGGGGNRWPRQETLALLKIRSDMDVVFRDATLKGPLWDDVSRKLGELGYTRSAKKCKEKFENVHKYYKRTKEGRAGRQDGKSYRFFTQLEALHCSGGVATAGADSQKPSFLLPAPPESATTQPVAEAPASLLELSTPAAVVGISFSSNTSSSSSETDGEETEEGGRKRKRAGWPGGSRKMMAFFDGLMKRVMERQEAMQQRFLETIEKREQDRMVREEAWKRQEMARMNREYELMAQERNLASSRDAAVISFLQKFAGSGAQTDQPPISVSTPPEESSQPPPPENPKPPPVFVKPASQVERNELVVSSEIGEGICVGSVDAISPSSSSSRWPKPEVLALIRLRSSLESRYVESGPKGPLWEEISLGMRRLGYNRNSKRCKEKWENINKYFKKVKETNKKRTEDAKTCPYFHELDALYRKKQLFAAQQPPPPHELSIAQKIDESIQTPAIENDQSLQNSRSIEGGNHEIPAARSNGTNLSQLFFGAATNRGSSTTNIKKPEYIVRELMGQHNQQHGGVNDYEKIGGGETVDSDTINHEFDDDEDEDDDEEDGGKVRYEIQFQRQAGGGARNGNSTGKVPTTAASSAGSFLAMVQ